MRFFSIDIETTGLNCSEDQILELAIVDSQTEKYLHIYVKHERIVGDPIAIIMNAKLIEKIEELWKQRDALSMSERAIWNIKLPHQIDFAICCFLESVDIERGKSINIAGKNVFFDLGFISKLKGFKMEGTSLKNLSYTFHTNSRVLDPASHYFVPSDTKLPDLKTCCERANYPFSNNHSALEDAIVVMKLLKNKGF